MKNKLHERGAMMNGDNELAIFKNDFDHYKKETDNKIKKLEVTTAEQEKRIQLMERSKEKTDFQYEQIMEMLRTLNEKTIPDLTKQIQEIKDKPNQHYNTVITSIISAIVGGAVGFVVNKILGK